MFRVTVKGTQIECETAADVLAIVRVAEKNIAVNSTKRRKKSATRKPSNETTQSMESGTKNQRFA